MARARKARRRGGSGIQAVRDNDHGGTPAMIDYDFLRSLDFLTVWKYLPVLIAGLGTNILLTAIGFICGGVVVGTLLALGNLSPRRLIRWPAWIFVEFWRSTPLLVQAIWVNFAVAGLIGILWTSFQS